MSEFCEQAYTFLVDDWHVDGDHDLRAAASSLLRSDRQAAIRDIVREIEYATARLRAYKALQVALEAQSVAALDTMRDKDITDINDWQEANCAE